MTTYNILLGGNRSGLSNTPFASMLPQDYTAPASTPPVPDATGQTGYANHKHAWNFHVNRFMDFNPPSPIAPAVSQALWTYYSGIRSSLAAADDIKLVLLFPKSKVVQITVDVITPVVGLDFDIAYSSGAIASLAGIDGSTAGFTASDILNDMVGAQDYVTMILNTVDATEVLDGFQCNVIVEVVDFNHISAW